MSTGGFKVTWANRMVSLAVRAFLSGPRGDVHIKHRRHRLAVEMGEETLFPVLHAAVVLGADQQPGGVVVLGSHGEDLVNVRLAVGDGDDLRLANHAGQLLDDLEAFKPAVAFFFLKPKTCIRRG